MRRSTDPYGRSLAVTLFFFYGAAGTLAWIAHNYPVGFVLGVLTFFLLIYGKLNPLICAFSLLRILRRAGR